jgi:large subunit ribosomal protein L29
MRSDEFRALSDADLVSRVRELEEERFRLRFRSATEALEDPLRLRVIRKDIARLKTIQRQRALGQSQVAVVEAPAQARRGGRRAGR